MSNIARNLSEYTTQELIVERDALAPRLRQEQRADWYEVRHRYLTFANEIARRTSAPRVAGST